MQLLGPAAEAILAEAVEIESFQDRQVYLDRACAGDPQLQKILEQLVRDYFQAGSFLEHPPSALDPGLTATHGPAASAPAVGSRIGAYTLRELMGEGGMGLVYVAEQSEPVRRKVALKLVKPGMDTRQVLARFEAERQALALMDHPNIARVLEAGSTPGGRPYFAMELVRGTPITEFCDANRLDLKKRLGLFLQVCAAVQHAHQKGVIHRDLKPSNVLVAVHDVESVVKVIDFGVAKATGQSLTDKTVYTAVAQIVGTPVYMSPEQAGQSSLDVDTRTDVYALGVLLYELLTGTTPFERERLKSVGLEEFCRVVREEEPARPSTRLSTLNAARLTTLADRRGADPRRLSSQVRGELDWVVMKCLEKDRNRRYESASGLAADIRRYLADEPVEARPPSFAYRARKFARRNRGPVVAGTLVLLALVGGIVGTTAGFLRARAEAADKDVARGAAVAESARATVAEEEAKRDRDKALAAEADTRAFSSFLINQVLAAGRPRDVQGGLGVDVTLAQALDAAEGQLATVFAGQPKAEALTRKHLGITWRNLGKYPKAVEHLERAVALFEQEYGPDHHNTLDAMNSLAQAYLGGEHWRKAIPLLERVLERRKAVLGPDDPQTHISMNSLGSEYTRAWQWDKARPLLEYVLEKRRAALGPDHPDTVRSMNYMASLYKSMGEYAKAEPLYVQVLEVRRRVHGDDHFETLASMNNLAVLYNHRGQYAKAEPLLLKALEISRRVYGDDHPHTITPTSNLAGLHRMRREYEKAEPLYIKVLEARRRIHGAEHPVTVTTLDSLGGMYLDQGDLAKSEPLLTQSLEISRRVYGDDHTDTLTTMNNVALLHQKKREYGKAESLFVQAMEGSRRTLGDEHPKTLTNASNLAMLYVARGQTTKGEPVLVKTLEASRRVNGDEHPDTLRVMNNLGVLYGRQRQYAKAEPLLAEAIEGSRRTHGDDHPETLKFMHNLAGLYLNQLEYAKAESLYIKTLKGRRRALGEEDPATLKSMNDLAVVYGRQGEYAKAEPLYVKGLEISRRVHGEEHPETLITQGNLATLYRLQGQFAKADPLLLKTLEVRRRVLPEGHIDTLINIGDLVSLYQTQKQYAKADPLCREAVEAARKRYWAESPELSGALANYGLNLLYTEKYADAEPVLRECLKIREAKQADDPRTFSTKSMLGGALLGQKKYADAEPLLLKGYEGMKEREAKIPAEGKVRLQEAAARLADLYDATGQPEKAKEWRVKAAPAKTGP
jgi:eukaryotic-like serine/threonine-protein kinase